MAQRGLGGLLLSLGLLVATPVLAATATDRADCAGNVDKQPDVALAACRRVIDDAGATAVERLEAHRNRGRASYNKRDYDRAIADYNRSIDLDPKPSRSDPVSREQLRSLGG